MSGVHCEVCGMPTHRRARAAASRFALCGYCGGLEDGDVASVERRELWRRVEARSLMDIYSVRIWADAVKARDWLRAKRQRRRRPERAA